MANGIFNAEQYLELYPALVEAGITVDTAWDHYATYGAGELRAPNAELDGKVYAASVLNYANANADVAEYFGIEVPATSLTQEQAGNVMLQYVLYGYDEERDAKIVDAPVERDDSDTVAAINDYQDAKAAETAAIKEAAKELDLEEESKDAVEAAANEAIIALGEDEDVGISDLITKNDDGETVAADLTLAVRNQLIKAKEDTLKAELAAEENLQGKALGAAKTLANASARLEAADKAVEKADEKLVTEVSVFTLYLEANPKTEGVTVNKDGEFGAVKLVIKNGKAVFVTKDDKPVTDGDDKALVKNIQDTEGYADYVGAFTANAQAKDKFETAQASKDSAQAKYDAQTPAPKGSFDDYKKAYDNVVKFGELTKDYKAAAAQLANIEAAEKDVAAAVEVLENMGYDVVLDQFATEGDDLFIYSEDANLEYYFDFGAEGEDAFFFGTQFSFVELAAGDDIAKGGFGDKNAFEVFAQQDGNDVVLYVETNEVGGTATGMEDLDTITLVGVDLADLQWDGGFLTVA